MISMPDMPSLFDAAALPGYRSLVISLLGLIVSYHLLSPLYTTAKQRSWILTAISSSVMTLASLPLFWDYVSSLGEVRAIRTLDAWTYPASRFFQAYLISDLLLGTVYYRSKVNLLTGWIHHTIYVFIVEYAIRKSWTHIFCLCAAMELPTFVLAIASLHSRFRSDILFAGCFLFTRIIFHIALCISYFVPANREVITNGSFMPSILLTLIFPLHAFWFYGCLKGFVKRATVKHVHRVVKSQITSDANTPGTASPSVSPHPSRLWVLPRRRGVLRHALRNLRWEHFELRRAAGRLNEARQRFHATLPATERVYAFVGLQRRNYAGKAVMEVQHEGW